jgi:glycosyltransferase involved in cell wall biosynthesis
MAVALARGLDRRGHDVRWTLLREPGVLGEALDPATELRAGLAPGRLPLGAIRRLRARLVGSDALYALDHQNAVVLAAAAAPLAAVRRRVVAIHTTGLWGGRRSLGRAFRSVLGSYQAVLALSPGHARYLIEREGVPEEKIRVVPNGVDLTRFENLPRRDAARERLGIPPEAEVVGSVAMLRPEKNQALLLEAAARLRRRRPGLVVVLAGEGPERERLTARAGREDLAGTVRFLGSRADVPEILPAFDAFVLSSLPAVETQPVAVLEAMAAGVPVVATRVGDLEALLEEGRAGILVPSGDAEALARAVERLLDAPAERAALAGRGRAVAERFSLDASVRALEDVLEGKS